jgi:uncharacterized protein (TIGR02246 family)
MKKLLYLIICLVCFPSPSFANESAQALQDAFVEALNDNDAQGLADCYTRDAVNFPVGAMIGIGPESVLESWNGFFAAYKVVGASLSDDHLEIHGDTAIAWGLFTIMAEPAEGGEIVEMKGRYMDVAKKVDGTWLYVADHASVPAAGPQE